jgi:hypothetical protein
MASTSFLTTQNQRVICLGRTARPKAPEAVTAYITILQQEHRESSPFITPPVNPHPKYPHQK